MGKQIPFFRELICIKNDDVEIHLIIPPTCERFCLKLYLLPVLTEMEGLLLSVQQALNNQPSIGPPA